MDKKIISFSKHIVFVFLLFFIYSTSQVYGQTNSKEFIMRIHYKRGINFYREGKYDKAIEEIERILEIDPKYAQAKKYLNAAIRKKNKKIISELHRQAGDYYKQKDYPKALEAYQKALELIPDDEYSLYKSELLRAQIEKLERVKQKQQDIQKQNTKELEKLIKATKKRKHLNQEQAKEKLEKNKNEKQKEDVKDISGEVLDDKYKNKEKALSRDMALDEQERMMSEKDKSEAGLINIAASKDKEQAPAVVQEEKREEKIKNIKIVYNRAKEYYNKKDYTKAIEGFQEVISLEAESKKIYTARANKYMDQAKNKLYKQKSIEKGRDLKDLESEMVGEIKKIEER